MTPSPFLILVSGRFGLSAILNNLIIQFQHETVAKHIHKFGRVAHNLIVGHPVVVGVRRVAHEFQLSVIHVPFRVFFHRPILHDALVVEQVIMMRLTDGKSLKLPFQRESVFAWHENLLLHRICQCGYYLVLALCRHLL